MTTQQMMINKGLIPLNKIVEILKQREESFYRKGFEDGIRAARQELKNKEDNHKRKIHSKKMKGGK